MKKEKRKKKEIQKGDEKKSSAYMRVNTKEKLLSTR